MMLDLKYRPQRFDDVLGNEGVKKLLLIRARNGTLGSQSMMFGGPKGCGKTSFARLVARTILCANLIDGEPCGECVSCTDFLNEVHPDVEELDAASQGTVDKVRTMIRDADYDTISSHRIYILDEAQRLSASAQDALLKAVEDRTFIVILCTTEPHKIREPIRSRVEEYPIHPPDCELILERMRFICNQEHIKTDGSVLESISQIHHNCPRQCLISLGALASAAQPITSDTIDQYFRFSSYELIVGLLSALWDLPKALVTLDKLSSKETPTWIRDNIVFAVSSAIRRSIGIGHSYPVSIDPILSYSQILVNLARNLSLLDRPLITDIEATIFDFMIKPTSIPQLSLESVPTPTPTPPIQKPEPKFTPIKPSVIHDKTMQESEPDPKPIEPKPSIKEVEIDGVKFSPDESLTSLDSKIESIVENLDNTSDTAVSVKLDEDNVPITERQFIDGFFNRYRGGHRV